MKEVIRGRELSEVVSVNLQTTGRLTIRQGRDAMTLTSNEAEELTSFLLDSTQNKDTQSKGAMSTGKKEQIKKLHEQIEIAALKRIKDELETHHVDDFNSTGRIQEAINALMTLKAHG